MLDDDINLDDYTGECDECGKKYIPANSIDHCPEEGLCWDHCTDKKHYDAVFVDPYEQLGM